MPTTRSNKAGILELGLDMNASNIYVDSTVQSTHFKKMLDLFWIFPVKYKEFRKDYSTVFNMK